MKHLLKVQLYTLLICTAGNMACKKSDNTDNSSNAIPDIKLEVTQEKDLGPLKMPPHLAGRDGGHATIISGKLVWIFGDSFFDRKGVDGMQYRTNTSCQSTPADPLNTTEPLDANGISNQFIPFTTAEKRFNDSTNSPTDRIGLWPTGIITTDQTTAIVFFSKVYLKDPWQDFGIGIAKYKTGQTTAVRNPDLLFNYPEPNFETAFLHDGYLYLYGRSRKNYKTLVTRAASKDLENRSAYEFWNGSEWVKDVEAAAAIHGDTGGSYSYNEHYKCFMHIYSDFGKNTAMVKFANRPQGPWSAAQVLHETLAPTKDYNYIIIEHPELKKNNDKTIFVSYSRPLPAFLAGEIRLIEINLK